MLSVRRCLLVLACVAWCALLAATTRVQSGERWPLHIAFNAGLAAVPLVLSGIAAWLLADTEAHRARVPRRALGWALLPAWLLCLPNAPYLFSELAHLRPRSGASWTLDLVLLCSVAGVGLLFTLVTLDDVHRLLSRRFGEPVAWRLLLPTGFACGFAMSLGRLQRWNSWDLLREPRALVWDALAHLSDPQALASTLGFGVMLGLAHALTRELTGARHSRP